MRWWKRGYSAYPRKGETLRSGSDETASGSPALSLPLAGEGMGGLRPPFFQMTLMRSISYG